MTQTRDNGGKVPTNSDEYDLTADLAAMVDSLNVDSIVANQAAMDALTKYKGRVCLRLDTGTSHWYNGTTWESRENPGISYPFLAPTNFVCSGTCMVTPQSDGTKKVEIDLTFTRTNSSLGLTGVIVPQSLGVVIPAEARGAAATKITSSYLNGGGQPVTPVQLNIVPASGLVEVRSQGATSWLAGASANANISYRI